MPTPIRFHLDESCHPAIADGRRRRGVDVTTTAEEGLIGTSDETQVGYVREQGRVLVTHDADFFRLHQAGAWHAGIVYCPQGRRTVGHILRSLPLITELLTPQEMQDHVEFA